MGHSYLTKRGQRYYFRMRVPSDLSRFFNQQFITASLRTSYYRQAKRRIRPIIHATEELFTTIRMGMVSEEKIAQLVRTYKDKLLEGYERQRSFGSNVYQAAMSGEVRSLDLGQDADVILRQYAVDKTEADLEAVIGHYLRGIEHRKELFRFGKIDDHARISAYHLAQSSGTNIALPPAEYLNPNEEAYSHDPPTDFNRLVRAMVRAEVEVLEIEIERLRGNDTEYDRELRRMLERPNKHLSEVCALIEAEHAQNNKNTSLIKVKQNHKALLRILGDKPLRDYDEQDILEAGEIIRKWPKKAASHKGLDHLTPKEIIQRKDLGPPIKQNSIKYRLTGLNSIFKYAVAKGWIDRSPCPTWKFKQNREANKKGELENRDRYLPWSMHEITRLLQTSFFTAARHRHKTPENFWLPLLALFTGCRQNELCQLYCDDIFYDDEADCWLLRVVVNDERMQGVKRETSIRRVPIHHTLIDLGLLPYREHIARDHERLFPNLTYHPTHENWSNAFSKRFGHHLKRHMEWDDPDRPKVFHGFRATFINTIRDRNHVLMEQLQYLVGHAPQHAMPAHYGGRPAAEILNGYLQKLDFGIDFVEILGRWETVK